LIDHRRWLARKDFVGGFMKIADETAGDPTLAFVDWSAALVALDSRHLGCSTSEDQVLRIAASIAEGIPVDLREAVTGLDANNAMLVVLALLHAAGHGRTNSLIEIGR
jgi:hypothetical protein